VPSGETRVTDVVSGDVVRLDDGRAVRLLGIDAPNGHACHAYLSRWTLAQLLPPGTTVDVRGGVGSAPFAGYLFRDDLNVNLELVRRGAASPYFPKGSGPFAPQLLRAADAAQASHRGAWGGCASALDPRRPWRLERRRSPDRIFR
jgi:endonuclease YncB( thermonuclease family)